MTGEITFTKQAFRRYVKERIENAIEVKYVREFETDFLRMTEYLANLASDDLDFDSYHNLRDYIRAVANCRVEDIADEMKEVQA